MSDQNAQVMNDDRGDRWWANAEDVEFTVRPRIGETGFVWIQLACSVCGLVTAAASPRDLGELEVEAQSHYDRKHLGAQ